MDTYSDHDVIVPGTLGPGILGYDICLLCVSKNVGSYLSELSAEQCVSSTCYSSVLTLLHTAGPGLLAAAHSTNVKVKSPR